MSTHEPSFKQERRQRLFIAAGSYGLGWPSALAEPESTAPPHATTTMPPQSAQLRTTVADLDFGPGQCEPCVVRVPVKRLRTALILSLSLAGGTVVAAQDEPIKTLLSKDLAGVPGREISMIMVEYPPGGSSPAHTHNAQAMVYVLEGSIVMQLKDQAPVTLTAGQSFYEGRDDVHLVSRNASSSAPARFVVFLAKDKGAPILKPLK